MDLFQRKEKLERKKQRCLIVTILRITVERAGKGKGIASGRNTLKCTNAQNRNTAATKVASNIGFLLRSYKETRKINWLGLIQWCS